MKTSRPPRAPSAVTFPETDHTLVRKVEKLRRKSFQNSKGRNGRLQKDRDGDSEGGTQVSGDSITSEDRYSFRVEEKAEETSSDVADRSDECLDQ